MSFEGLTTNAERVLQEILDHRREDSSCDTGYWKKRCHEIEPLSEEDQLLQSAFAELQSAGMISALWGDDYPCELVVLGNGLLYFETKQGVQKREKKEKRASEAREWAKIVAEAGLGQLGQWLSNRFGG